MDFDDGICNNVTTIILFNIQEIMTVPEVSIRISSTKDTSKTTNDLFDIPIK